MTAPFRHGLTPKMRPLSPIRPADSIVADYTAKEDILSAYAQGRLDMFDPLARGIAHLQRHHGGHHALTDGA